VRRYCKHVPVRRILLAYNGSFEVVKHAFLRRSVVVGRINWIAVYRAVASGPTLVNCLDTVQRSVNAPSSNLESLGSNGASMQAIRALIDTSPSRWRQLQSDRPRNPQTAAKAGESNDSDGPVLCTKS
jgi:hypothetical protein